MGGDKAKKVREVNIDADPMGKRLAVAVRDFRLWFVAGLMRKNSRQSR